MKSDHAIRLWTPNTGGLLFFILLGTGVALYRMLYGLGAATNLNDTYPWGLWLGFDVLGGVAMAAGGFIIAAAVYLFNWRKYRPIARPAILTAFLGYLLAVLALFLDIGHPFRLWHPAIMWQVHSVMWVVAIHVILYTTTLAVEASPMLFEKLHWERAGKWVGKIYLAAVVFGVMLSTLHQSSLGAVFLIAPAKLSPLWFDPLLPYMFLISAVAMGLAMVSTEAMLSARAFHHPVAREIFTVLGRGLRNTLLIYLGLKLYLLFKHNGLAIVFGGGVPGNMYLIEMGIGVLLPLGLLVAGGQGLGQNSLLGCNIMVIVGVLTNRMNVAVFGMQDYAVGRGAEYFPAPLEFLLTLGLVALGVFLFKAAARYLPLFTVE